jgi:hypothetical protein
MSEVWKFLKETLPKYQWPEDKNKVQTEEDQLTAVHGVNIHLFLNKISVYQFLTIG